MKQENIKILLIQFRTDATEEHEREGFAKHLGISKDQIVSLNVCKEKLNSSSLDNIDAVIIGGAGEFCISKNDLPVQDEFMAFIRLVREKQISLLGVCYGCHAMAEAFGGLVISDKSRQETKTFDITRNEISDQDPVMSRLPKVFAAQLGHTDHVEKLPEDAINFASSELSFIQAWGFPGESTYAVQFHPELDQEANRERVVCYRDIYLKDDDVFKEAYNSVRPSPEASKFLRYFLEECVLKQKVDKPVD